MLNEYKDDNELEEAVNEILECTEKCPNCGTPVWGESCSKCGFCIGCCRL